ncbi:acyl-CoA thioester hydrolase [Paenibacillus swuensis]|uniref:Acyl-CoA thioester hydrolase n=1 Tax=Paenibacillus swuensis TaxID=1178515 RepID=A0A172TM36_9BACL|nr:acyl-CoA thioesterase [Paenibacillus swuensis]ANE48139.1 acyl-CoA thioester hydrolase [Paenibacillus swuensis]
MKAKKVKETRVIRTDLVMPNDTNNHNTMFGGILMRNMDANSAIAARRHCRTDVVTASTDSVDFLHPIRPTDSICLESFVTWTGTTSIEVFTKAVAEDLNTGERKIAATAFLTFVSVNEAGQPQRVAPIAPETDEERKLHETGASRAEMRKVRRTQAKELASFLSMEKPWE